jgi:hypothetical protein
MVKIEWVILCTYLAAAGYAATIYPPTNLMYYLTEGIIFMLMLPWVKKIGGNKV